MDAAFLFSVSLSLHGKIRKVRWLFQKAKIECFMSMNDDETLSRLLTYFSSSYSSNGKLKLIQTLDSSMNVLTSRSSRVIRPLKCQRTISRLLLAAMEKHLSMHHDGGLFYAMLFGRFLAEIRAQPTKLTDLQTCLTLIEQIDLDSPTLEFQSIQPLLALVRGVICKPLAYDFSDQCREEICVLTTKAFLEKITSNGQYVLTIEGLPIDESKLFTGLLYPIHSPKALLCASRTRPCLYFTVSLAGDHSIEDLDVLETRDELFRWIQNVAKRLSDGILRYTQLHHGGLVLCQKVGDARSFSVDRPTFLFLPRQVIYPSIKSQLKRMGVETIDRLSLQYTSLFCAITGKEKENDKRTKLCLVTRLQAVSRSRRWILIDWTNGISARSLTFSRSKFSTKIFFSSPTNIGRFTRYFSVRPANSRCSNWRYGRASLISGRFFLVLVGMCRGERRSSAQKFNDEKSSLRRRLFGKSADLRSSSAASVHSRSTSLSNARPSSSISIRRRRSRHWSFSRASLVSVR